MAGKNEDQQSAAPRSAAPKETAAARPENAPPPVPEEEPARAETAETQDQVENTTAPLTEEEPQPTPAEPAGDAVLPNGAAQDGADDAPDDGEEEAGEDEADSAEAPNDGNNEAADTDAEADADDADGAGENEEEESEEERRRVAEMTRTVQLSLEQITARRADLDAAQAAEEEADGERDAVPEPAPTRYRKPSLGRRIGRAAGSGVLHITRWLLLVVFFVALIAAVGIAFLYRGATADLIPKVSVTLDGQTVPPTAYDWNVPVVNHLFSRRYHGTNSETAVTLEKAVEGIRPELVVTPQEFESHLVLKDSAGNELYSGSVFGFREFTFEKDGTYAAELTVANKATQFDVNAVEGSQTYDFTFDISLHPSVRLDTSSALQGDVVAVVAAGIPLSDKPTLICGFENIGFVPALNGWIAYVPIPMDAEPGEYPFTVQSSRHEQTMNLTVHERAWRELKLADETDLHWAWIGPDNTPNEVLEALKTNEDKIYWEDEGFAMPYDEEKVEVELDFGTAEIVDDGAGPDIETTRRSINMVGQVDMRDYGSPLTAPAAGRVIFAEDLGGELSPVHGVMLPNKTVVVDHGGGLKTVYYNLNTIDVKVGDVVEQGQTVGTCQLTVCVGAYAGTVPVDPLTLWQGQSNAVRFY